MPIQHLILNTRTLTEGWNIIDEWFYIILYYFKVSYAKS